MMIEGTEMTAETGSLVAGWLRERGARDEHVIDAIDCAYAGETRDDKTRAFVESACVFLATHPLPEAEDSAAALDAVLTEFLVERLRVAAARVWRGHTATINAGIARVAKKRRSQILRAFDGETSNEKIRDFGGAAWVHLARKALLLQAAGDWPPQNLGGWLVVVLKNLVTDFERGKKKGVGPGPVPPNGQPSDEENPWEKLPDTEAAGPAEQVDQRRRAALTLALVNDAIATLSDRYRVSLKLAYYLKLTSADYTWIAEQRCLYVSNRSLVLDIVEAQRLVRALDAESPHKRERGATRLNSHIGDLLGANEVQVNQWLSRARTMLASAILPRVADDPEILSVLEDIVGPAVAEYRRSATQPPSRSHDRSVRSKKETTHESPFESPS